VALLVAVLEKRLGMHLMGHDIFMNVAGGVKVHEPAVDLAVIAAVASSFTDRSVPQDTIVMGEVGLTGEVRAVSHLETRVVESQKMGFTRALVPRGNLERLKNIPDIEVVGIRTVDQAVETLF
jgi:DNA repair protein RadA/Sms